MAMTTDGARPRYRLLRILLPGRAQHSSGGAEITRARRVDRTGLTPLLPAAIAVFVAIVSVADVRAQFLPAGAWDDPRENIQDVWWRHENRLDVGRSEEHTSELQSRGHLVCRLLLAQK